MTAKTVTAIAFVVSVVVCTLERYIPLALPGAAEAAHRCA